MPEETLASPPDDGGGIEIEYDEGGLDPFDPGFGSQLGETISQAVADGVAGALGFEQPEKQAFDEYEPELTPEQESAEAEQLAEGEKTIAGWLAEFGEEVGPFDQALAVQKAEELFPVIAAQLEAEGVEIDDSKLAYAAVWGGATLAAQENRGQGFADAAVVGRRVVGGHRALVVRAVERRGARA